MKFENRVAVVTGGAGRIGRETARMFCEEGVAVALCDISAEGVEKVAAELREKGYNCKGYVMDVCSTESVNAAAAKIYADFEKVDILVNNAGRWKCTIFDDMTEEQWIDTINLNLHGVFRVTKAFLLRERAKAYEGNTTPSCREKCSGCGANCMGGERTPCPKGGK